jgi:hypothetical protein
MSFVQITACLTVEEKDGPEVNEALLDLIDSLAVKRIPVFDSDVYSQRVKEASNADEVREEIRSLVAD